MIWVYGILLGFLLIPVLVYLVLLQTGSGTRYNPPEEKIPEGISVVMPCYNEAERLSAKIRELQAECERTGVPYEIIVISDGSEDETKEILRNDKEEIGLRFKVFARRRGKPAALNEGMKMVRFPLVLFSDVRQQIEPGSVARLFEHFRNPEIGAVSSQLLHRRGNPRLRNLLNDLKLRESRTGSTPGVYGGLFMVRRQCLRPVPEKVILDDLYLATHVLGTGHWVILEPEAIIYDQEFDQFYRNDRVCRLIAGLLQFPFIAGRNLWRLPLRQKIYFWVQKYLKLCLPFPLGAMTVLACFSSGIALVHFCLLAAIIVMGTLWDFRGMMQILRFSGTYFASILKMRSLITPLWKKE